MPSRSSLLATCPCPAPCSDPRGVLALTTAGVAWPFAAREVLWSQGNPADRVLAVCSGVVEVVRPLGTGARLRRFETNGALLGFDHEFWSGRRSTDAVALSAGVGVRVPAEAVRRLLRGGGELAFSMASCFGRGSLLGDAQVLETGVGPLPQRVARLLVRLVGRGGVREGAGARLGVALPRSHLAEALQCRLESLLRTLKAEPLCSLAEVRRDAVVIHDLAALRAFGETGSEPAA